MVESFSKFVSNNTHLVPFDPDGYSCGVDILVPEIENNNTNESTEFRNQLIF